MPSMQDVVTQYLAGHSSKVFGDVHIVPVDSKALPDVIRTLMRKRLPLMTIVGSDEGGSSHGHMGRFRIRYVFRAPGSAYIVPMITLSGTEFPSMASEFPAFALYEREICTMFGLTAIGHPDPRTLILHEENWPSGKYPLRKDFPWNEKVPETKSGEYRFDRIGGEGIYEIPVGPVHAGIIEPGHFRFSVLGEEILNLEARLGWVHKGVEKLFETLPIEKYTTLAEHISGDASFSHSLALCQALESLTGTRVPERAKFIRLIFSELERLTMHIFDIGNIAGNGTGFSFMAAQGFRIVENLRRLHEALSGSRYLRGINTPGGVTKDLSDEDKTRIAQLLAEVKKEFTQIIKVADGSASLINRLQRTGILPKEVIEDYGAVGMGARGCNIERDARIEHPYAAYDKLIPTIALEETGDVQARFKVRIKEVHESIRLIEKAVGSLPAGPLSATLGKVPHEGTSIGTSESWRGEVVYAMIAENGVISRVKVRDPSFISWQLFSHLIPGDMVPDFPLINKSFNLSYTGNDL